MQPSVFADFPINPIHMAAVGFESSGSALAKKTVLAIAKKFGRNERWVSQYFGQPDYKTYFKRLHKAGVSSDSIVSAMVSALNWSQELKDMYQESAFDDEGNQYDKDYSAVGQTVKLDIPNLEAIGYLKAWTPYDVENYPDLVAFLFAQGKLMDATGGKFKFPLIDGCKYVRYVD